MKAYLMHVDQDFDVKRELPSNAPELVQDLELSTMLEAMALGDKFLFAVAKTALLSSMQEPAAIVYRQDILRDCLEHTSLVREIYDLAVEAIQRERKVWGVISDHYPDSILHRSIEVLELFMGILKRLREFAETDSDGFRSEGFTMFFAMLAKELSDEYFDIVDDHLKRLKFRDGVLISAQLGKGAKGIDYVLRKPGQSNRSWIDRITGIDRSAYSFTVPDRDEAGATSLSHLQGQGINLVANALARSTDHILSFFHMLRAELGFYVGCLNLQEKLAGKGEPLCFPEPFAPGTATLSFRGLYDGCLSLSIDERVVGNDVSADGKSLVMVTGANEGGKSTFLRSVGLAQLMMQCGMFVPAESFAADVCEAAFTHYRREEDSTMSSGKLDEELSRMSDIADRIGPNCVLLCNESFAATNEREGSQIAREIIRALLEAGVRVFFVTHLFDLAHGLYRQHPDTALFLRAPRQSDGKRTFRLVEGEPLSTSYGQDLYRRVFGAIADAAPAAASEPG